MDSRRYMIIDSSKAGSPKMFITYQGRECSNIIMSLVDNEVKDFSDDPNLMNVAISRAKDRLFIVTSGNDIDEQSNMG